MTADAAAHAGHNPEICNVAPVDQAKPIMLAEQGPPRYQPGQAPGLSRRYATTGRPSRPSRRRQIACAASGE